MQYFRLPLLDDFLLNLQVNNYSPETIYNYERDLQTFEFFLNDQLHIKDFQVVSKRTLELYKAYLTSSDRKTPKNEVSHGHLGPGSINRHLSALRRYLEYLIEMEFKTPVVPQNIKLIKTPKHVSKVAELDELKRLIESPTHFEKNKFIAARNRALLEIIFSTGVRISEIVNLTLTQIDPQGRIFVMGKGKKERFVYLTERAKQHLDKYLQLRKVDLPFLFIPSRGSNTSKRDAHISPAYLQAKIKEYRERLGINVPTSAHSLRHGFATYLAEQGASPAAIQILLGHESLDTTTRYVHASDHFAESQHRKFHPLKEDHPSSDQNATK